MILFTLITVITLKLALALPSNNTLQKQFSIPLIRKEISTVNGSNSYANTTLSARGDVGLVGPTLKFLGYSVETLLDDQPVSLLLDTAHHYSWAYSSLMRPKLEDEHRIFHPRPESVEVLGSLKVLRTDHVSGFFCPITVRVGDLVSLDQEIGAAVGLRGVQYRKDHFSESMYDGQLGLGRFERHERRSFLLGSSDNTRTDVFTLSLRKQNAPSTLYFGGIDPSYRGLNPVYVPLFGLRRPGWAFKVTGMSVNTEELVHAFRASLDTTNRTWFLPADLAKAFYDQIPRSRKNEQTGQEYLIPCDSKLPSITIHTDRGSFSAPATNLDLSVEMFDGVEHWCDCGIQALPPGEDEYQFGVSFFLLFFTIFDYGLYPKVGFVPHPPGLSS